MAETMRVLLEQPGPKFGHFVVEFATPGIGHILKGAGCDFVLFDTEHSGFGFETMKSAVRYFEAAQLPAIIRVALQGLRPDRAGCRHGRRGHHAAHGRHGRGGGVSSRT